jgi:hypothetical protein
MVKQSKPVSEAQRASRAKASARMKAMHEAKRQKKIAKIPEAVDDPAPERAPADRETSRQAREDTREGFGRSKRKPLGVAEQRLSAKVPDGMTGRWMNDVPGRLTRALEGDYQFIGDDGEVVQNRKGGRSEIVGTGREGGAMRAYLMAIPTVLYEQDQRAKAALNKERMTAIKRGEPSQVADQDRSAFYTPSEGISIRENTTSER